MEEWTAVIKKEHRKYVDANVVKQFGPEISHVTDAPRNTMTITCRMNGFDQQLTINTQTQTVTYNCIVLHAAILKVLKLIFNDGAFNKEIATVHSVHFDACWQELFEWDKTYTRLCEEEKAKKIINPTTHASRDRKTELVTLDYVLSPWENTVVDDIGDGTVDSVRPKMEQFIKFLTIIRASQYNSFVRGVKEGKISYHAIDRLYKIKTKYLFPFQNSHEVGVLIYKNYDPTYDVWTFNYQYTAYDPKKKKFVIKTRSYNYSNSLMIIDIDSLPIKAYTEDMRETYLARGALYMKIVPYIHHMHYKGMFSSRYLSGRVVVDDAWSSQVPTDVYEEPCDDEECDDEEYVDDTPVTTNAPVTTSDSGQINYNLAPHEIDICTPYISCYALDLDAWGQCLVTDLSAISYRDDAFEHLCLDSLIAIGDGTVMRKKDLIRKLVTNYDKIDRRDFIDGKTSGLIITLHGPPGVGKTLTAEATSEVLHRPLCKISAGALGTTPATVEEALRKFFDNVKRWNGIALIDEVDIFLEKRTSHTDIVKNAIVGVFLRMIEYCNAITFMTSNRIDCIDPAIDNRIDVKLEYGELSVDDKVRIYESKTKHIKGMPDESPDDVLDFMARYPHLNGRNLKSIIKTGQYVTWPEPPSLKHFAAVTEMMSK